MLFLSKICIGYEILGIVKNLKKNLIFLVNDRMVLVKNILIEV